MDVSSETENNAPLLTPANVREIAARIDVRPTKVLGQNFVHDANTVRRIVRAAELHCDDVVMEVGPGLGSLTLALLDTGAPVIAVEIDPKLAAALPETISRFRPEREASLAVLNKDALALRPGDLIADGAAHLGAPTALVANLPYNVAVPVLLTVLERFESVRRVLVMVQAEVADRLAAGPGSRVYGAPSVKAAWYGDVERAGLIPRQVFWPVPNVESGLVRLTRRSQPLTGGTLGEELAAGVEATPSEVFAVVDAAFAQRRKMLRSALGAVFGGEQALVALERAGVDPTARGETVDIEGFIRIALALRGSDKSGSTK